MSNFIIDPYRFAVTTRASYDTTGTNPPTLGITFSELDKRATASGTNNRCACHAAENSSVKSEFTASYSGTFGADMAFIALQDSETISTTNTPQSGADYYSYFIFNAARDACLIKAYKDTTEVFVGGDMGALPKCYWLTDGTDVKFFVDGEEEYSASETKTYYVRACPSSPSVYMDIY